jgi:hypothetical protein
MQSGYSYVLEASEGQQFDDGFTQAYSPIEKRELGIFEGRYLNDCQSEFPTS